MSNTVKKPLLSAGTMTRIAILAAAASILFLLEIPVVAFYKLDLSNIPVLLGAFSMGTVPGLIILGLKSAIGLLHSSSAGVGELADFIMGAALLIPASVIYHRHKTRKNALIGMLTGTLFAFATALGFGLALILFAGIREQLALAKVPEAMKGTPIALLTAGLLAMAFMGFSGVV